jgi:hypothetical protein
MRWRADFPTHEVAVAGCGEVRRATMCAAPAAQRTPSLQSTRRVVDLVLYFDRRPGYSWGTHARQVVDLVLYFDRRTAELPSEARAVLDDQLARMRPVLERYREPVLASR